MSGHMCVHMSVCFYTVHTVYLVTLLPSLATFLTTFIFISLSFYMLLSVNQFACESTFRTNCMYFFPGARIDNWIRGSIISTQWPSLIRGTQSEWEAERGNCVS